MRDKLSRKRKVLTEDEEKPFLEHLEDLRKMIMRIAITLVVAVIGCFAFNSWFFKIVRYPMQSAGLASAMEKNLPEGLDMPKWMSIHNAARGASILDGDLRRHFLEQALPDAALRPYVEALLIYHATALLPESAQEGFMETAVKTLPPERAGGVLAAAQAIRTAKPSPSLEEMRPVIENVAMAPAETFMLSMKLSTFAGIIVSFPLLFYFLLEFILPGLNYRERKLMWPALSIGFGLFLTGVIFAYLAVIPGALEYFHEYSAELGVKDTWRIGDYISFVTTFCLIFGVSFELPVVVMILVKLDLLSASTMRRTRAWAVIIIVVAGAILTPTQDIVTLSLMSGPMIVMYECCIWLAVLHERRRMREEAEEENRDMARRAALVGVASVSAPKPGSVVPAEDIYSNPAPDYHTDPAHGGDADHGHELDGRHGHDSHHDGWAHDSGNDDGKPSADASEDVSASDAASAGSSSAWANHPHHPDPEKPTAEEEQAQYMREHAHLFQNQDTHPESIPVEERQASLAPASTPPSDPEPATEDTEAPAETGDDAKPAGDAGTKDGEPKSPDPENGEDGSKGKDSHGRDQPTG